MGLVAILLAGAVEAATRHALLVGVTRYEHLNKYFWLDGAANDAALMKDLLISRFDFRPEHITTLAGWPDTPESRPTRANIKRELRRLGEVAGPDDQVVILLSGHGSQQPAAEDAYDREPDGYDEIFLPADVRGWNRSKGAVENAIVDDELRDWLRSIRDRGAFVWVIVDSCHSGTMTRGAPRDYERERRIPIGMLIPEEVIGTAGRGGTERERTRGVDGGRRLILDLSAPRSEAPPTPGGLVALYAAQAYEVTTEVRRPQGSNARYGLFTYTLAEILQQSKSTLTYQELVERVSARYRIMGRFQPTPLIEGRERDREILGLQDWPERPRLLLGEDENGDLRLQAGQLHGVHPGTILAVYPPAGAAGAGDAMGHVRVTRVGTLTAHVEPSTFVDASTGKERAAAPAQELVPGSLCEIVFVDYGDFRLNVAVQVQTDLAVDTVTSDTGPEVIEASLDEMAKTSGNLIKRVTEAGEADWYVRIHRNKVVLVPASGLPSDVPLTPGSPFTLGETSDAGLGKSLQQALMRLARAHNLLHIATEAGSGNSRSGGLDVSVEMLDGQGKPVAYGPGGREVYGGDSIIVKLTNENPYPIDLTVLLVDSRYGISSLFPDPLDNNRLEANQTVSLLMRVVEPFGRDQLVVIAVKGSGTAPMDFTYLAQPGLRARSARASETPLEQLLNKAVFNRGSTRGATRETANEYTVRLIGWTSRQKRALP